jgi:hypothetical protein
MDDQHQSDLSRILENRRAGGRLKSEPSPAPSMSPVPAAPHAAAPAAAATPPPQQAAAPVQQQQQQQPQQQLQQQSQQSQYAAAPRAASPMRHAASSPNMVETRTSRLVMPMQYRQAAAAPAASQPYFTSSTATQNTVPAAESARTPYAAPAPLQPAPAAHPAVENGNVTRQLSTLQSQLVQSQDEQAHRLNAMQEDLRVIQEALVGGSTGGNYGGAPTRSLSRSRGMMQNVPRMVPAPPPLNAPPRPSVFDSSGRHVARATPVDFPTRFNLTAPTPAPAAPPAAARPFASSSIDLDTSVALLATGDWFLKWNVSGSDVKPQFFWLDHDTKMLQWGKSPKAAGFLSSFVKLEEIHNVTTSQMLEHHDRGAKVFYILVIHARSRVLRVGTERQDKLNAWYDALSNIMAYYRMQGHLRSRRFRDHNASSE